MDSVYKNQPFGPQVDVVVRGQLYNQGDHIAYSSNSNDEDWAWRFPREHREILADIRVVSGKQCISIWNITSGVCYSICQDPQQRPGSAAAIMVRAPYAAINPLGLLACMRELMAYMLQLDSEKEIDPGKVKEIQQRMSPCFGSGVKPQKVSKEDGVMAYVEYGSNEQLEQICFSLPFQPEMEEYACIHLVAEEDHRIVESSVNLKRYNSKTIRPVYFFQQPSSSAGKVRVSVENNEVGYVLQGQKFCLSYERVGYECMCVDGLKIETESKYFKRSGNTIFLRSADEVGVTFTKNVNLKVFDSETKKSIDSNKWGYRIDGENAKNGSDGVHLPDGKHKLSIFAEGYRSEDIEIDIVKNNSVYPIGLYAQGFEKKYDMKPSALFFKQEGWDVKVTGKKTGLFWEKYEHRDTLHVSRINWAWCALLIGLAMLIGGCLIGRTMWTSNSDSLAASSEKTSDMTAGVEGGSCTAEEKDVNYLNSHDVWYLDTLKSDAWKKFFEETLPNKSDWVDNKGIVESVTRANDCISHWGWKLYFDAYKTSKVDNYVGFNAINKAVKEHVDHKKVDWNEIIPKAFKELRETIVQKQEESQQKGSPKTTSITSKSLPNS